MSKRDVDNETWGTPDSRRAEAGRLYKIIYDSDHMGQMTFKELQLILTVSDILETPAESISPAQLSYLRDIKDKYL